MCKKSNKKLSIKISINKIDNCLFYNDALKIVVDYILKKYDKIRKTKIIPIRYTVEIDLLDDLYFTAHLTEDNLGPYPLYSAEKQLDKIIYSLHRDILILTKYLSATFNIPIKEVEKEVQNSVEEQLQDIEE